MNKKKIIVILAGLGLAFGLGYLLFRKPKKDEETGAGETSGGETSGGETSGGETSGGGTSATLPTNPFKTEEEVKRFQSFAKIYSGIPNWVGYPIKAPVYLGTTGDNGVGIDGKWGTRTAQAYKDYGTLYNTKVNTEIPEKSKQWMTNIISKAKKDSTYGCKWTDYGLKNLYIYYYNDFKSKFNTTVEAQFNDFLLRFSDALNNVKDGAYTGFETIKIKNAFSFGCPWENKKFILYKDVVYDAKYGRPMCYGVNNSNFVYNAIASASVVKTYYSPDPNKPTVGEITYKTGDRLGKCSGIFIYYDSQGATYIFYRFTNGYGYERFVAAGQINLEVRKATGNDNRLETYPALFTRDSNIPKYHPYKIYM